MSPVTVAGTAAQTLAEALAGMALAQLVNPGAPVILGSFASSISMQSGAPTFGTPEPALVLYVDGGARAAARACRSAPAARCAPRRFPDAQAAYESANTLMPTCLGGVNFVLHTAGWLEGGLAMGYEKFVMDVDQAGMMHTLLAGVDLSENGQALDAIREVGPGKHFLGCAHTQANFETAFYRSPLADNNSVEQWEAEGSQDMAQRANALWKKQLGRVRGAAARPGGRRGAARLHEAAQGVLPRLKRLGCRPHGGESALGSGRRNALAFVRCARPPRPPPLSVACVPASSAAGAAPSSAPCTAWPPSSTARRWWSRAPCPREPQIARASAAAWFLERAYTSYEEMARVEAADARRHRLRHHRDSESSALPRRAAPSSRPASTSSATSRSRLT